MALAVVYSRASVGIDAPQVVVETHLSKGLPRFTIVGLPEATVKESKDRVRSALLQSGCELPLKRITINLAPADLPKEGGRFDLPIAIGILLASKQLKAPDIHHYELAGELGLSGELRSIKGILPHALAAHKANRHLIIPWDNQAEASWVTALTSYPAKTLLEVIGHLSQQAALTPTTATPIVNSNSPFCFSNVCGQASAKRALEIAAAGGHSLLMAGPPGTGKTMLATRIASILPPLTIEETLEVAAIYSISQHGYHHFSLGERPFRRPHHTASAVSLVGGGRNPLPGEISLAHQGILFLDELPEFSRHALEVLREPLETNRVYLSRAASHAEYPANCQLIAAMNPCPCGYLGDVRKICECSPPQIQRYRNKLSGPLLDRIDMHIEVPALLPERLANFNPLQEETSTTIQTRVLKARQQQLKRGALNAKLSSSQIMEICKLDDASRTLLTDALEKLGISARAYHRILKVARTIADLEDSDIIQCTHVAQAISYRKHDRPL